MGDASSTSGATRLTAAALPHSARLDVTARSGRVYRIDVAFPVTGGARAGALPTAFVLDGNVMFATAAETARLLSLANEMQPCLVVGVGYPTDDYAEWTRRRRFELTPERAAVPGDPDALTGGGREMAAFLVDELPSIVGANCAEAGERRYLIGASAAAHLACHVLVHRPERFDGFGLVSPATFISDNLNFRELERVHALPLAPDARVFLGVGARETMTPPGARGTMVEQCERLDRELARVAPAARRECVVFEGETHHSVVAPAVSRALRWLLPPALIETDAHG